MRYDNVLQVKPDGAVIDAYWFTTFPMRRAGSKTLYQPPAHPLSLKPPVPSSRRLSILGSAFYHFQLNLQLI